MTGVNFGNPDRRIGHLSKVVKAGEMTKFAFLFVNVVFVAVATSLVLVFFSVTADAQTTRNISSSARRIEEFNKQGNNAARDEMNSEMRGKRPTAEEMRKAKAIEKQIEEDLAALQTKYNDVVVKLQSKDAISDVFVVDAAGRIHKHAERLKNNIKFPELKDDEPVPDTASQATTSKRKMLVDLCTQILRFFDSPLFASPNVLDIQKANEARQILETVILKSAVLKSGSN